VIDNLYLLVGLAFLLAVDVITVTARTALLHTNLARLLSQREEMGPQVHRTTGLLQSLPRLQATMAFTQVILRFLLVGLIILLVYQQPGGVSLLALAGILIGSALALFWLEWVVEILTLRSADLWALRLTSYAQVLTAIMSPIVALPLRFYQDGQPDAETTGIVTEDELKILVDAGQEEGLLEQGERRMIYSIFELGDTLAREIMVPRIDVLALDVETTLIEAVDALLASGYSRVPVFEESIDHIQGLLYAKDLLKVWREGNHVGSLRDLLRRAYFVPEAKKVDELLTEMQSQRVHMAVVVDEYGGVAGVVTLEDIIEEILGEIQDEYDQAEELPFQKIGEGEYLFRGRIDLDDFNEIVDSHLPTDEADTLGGYIYSRIGRVPTTGETVQADNLLLTVEQVSGRRIRKVRAVWNPYQEAQGGKATHANRE
jgi:putative hemolysin